MRLFLGMLFVFFSTMAFAQDKIDLRTQVDKVIDSVVYIKTVVPVYDEDTGNKKTESKHGVGSGFIINKDGTIITNAHVVKNATSVEVYFHNKMHIKAKVLFVDQVIDIAVLRVPANDQFKPVELDLNATDINVGDPVFAIGAPFGLNYTVTAGIISNLTRPMSAVAMNYIQTDTTINPGNSGGPLFNSKGQVIGINSMIYSKTGTSDGLGFAIPIWYAEKTWNDWIKDRRPNRGALGLRLENYEYTDATGYVLSKGAHVKDVKPDGQAAKAGIQANDIITKIDNVDIETANDVTVTVFWLTPGSKVQITVLRGSDTKTFDAEVGMFDLETYIKMGQKSPDNEEE